VLQYGYVTFEGIALKGILVAKTCIVEYDLASIGNKDHVIIDVEKIDFFFHILVFAC
jgi:hypothetical protein